MRYRRSHPYLFAFNLADRSRGLLVEYVDVLRGAFKAVKHRHPFRIDAVVVLPDHLHAIWTLPAGDADFPTRWMLIKAGFSRGVPRGERVSASRQSKGERGLWQRRYWEHTIRDEDDFRRHLDYIHHNPVKHGHAARPADSAHSSIHRYIDQGILPADWGEARAPAAGGEFGE